MAGREEPPEDLPSGGEDEYRSVVFDESFIRAARLQEFSAQERMGDHALAVRSRSALPFRGGKGALVLFALILLAFGTAVFLGVRHPYDTPGGGSSEPLWESVVPLAPQGAVPGATAAELFANSPAAHFRVGAEGVNLPAVGRTAHFADSQVVTALTTATDYIVASSLDPLVLMGTTVRPVRALLDPDQYRQFDRSVASPSRDGRHAVTGWLVRFDPAQVALADPRVRVSGTLRYEEISPGILEVTADHTFVYALRPASAGPAKADGASLFSVRRELHFHFDAEDLRLRQAQLVISYVQAGPQDCAADTAGRLQPMLAGERAHGRQAGRGPVGTDPYATGGTATALCGTLAAGSQPDLSGDGP
ncbi:SCO2583 family membrane protein [Streptomyces sp. NBC_00344]|uniref:SCO2583 family membrane protein n=1 Tax=Streptomyces sp. NBC_00344 TaxID=2975720 RepID=UPI002E201210